MANKMITEKELRDDFLSAMIRSEDPERAPEGFTDEVMKRISLMPAAAGSKPYSPPLWLKWGIPGIIISSLLILVIWGPAKEPEGAGSGFSFFEKILNTVNAWFSGLKLDLSFPDLHLPVTILWILAGGILLMLSFVLLDRFLENRRRL